MESLSATSPNASAERSPLLPGLTHAPRLAMTTEGARSLLHAWENTDHGGTPRKAAAAADFYLPFLPEIDRNSTPYVALWEKGGVPDGILIGRLGNRRPLVRIGKWQFPMPRLRTLNITEGGLEARSSETAERQAEYLRRLLADGDLDCISVFRIPGDTEIGGILASGLRSPGDGNPETIGRWFTELNDRNGRPIVSYSSKALRNFRRKDRKLVSAFDGAVDVIELRGPGQINGFISTAAKICAASYQQCIGVGIQDNGWWNRMLGIHAENGNLRCYLLEAGGEPIAYLAGPVVGGTFTMMATSFLPKFRTLAPGCYLLRRVIERLQLEGVRWIDYGVGDYRYKKLHGTWRRDVATLNLYAPSPIGKAAQFLDTIVKRLNRALYRTLEHRGWLERIRHQRRQLGQRRKSS